MEEHEDPIVKARRDIDVALDGLSKEQACVILAAVAAESGFYDQAIQFLELAKRQRDAVWRPRDATD
jgi:hypothetical protein